MTKTSFRHYGQVWNLHARHFTALVVVFRSPLVYVDPAHVDMTNLFVQLFQDALNEYSYDAELAGLYYNLDSTRYGLQVW